MIVFVEPARSALPPISQGIRSANAFRTLPEATRVASGPSCGSNFGIEASQPSGGTPANACSKASASAG